jgi:hypothetical protein
MLGGVERCGTNMIASCIFELEDPADLKWVTPRVIHEGWLLKMLDFLRMLGGWSDAAPT